MNLALNFLNSLGTELNLSSNLTQQGATCLFSSVPYENGESCFSSDTHCCGLTDVFAERRGFGTRLCTPHTGRVSLQSGSVDETQRVTGKARGNPSAAIAVTTVHSLDGT